MHLNRAGSLHREQNHPVAGLWVTIARLPACAPRLETTEYSEYGSSAELSVASMLARRTTSSIVPPPVISSLSVSQAHHRGCGQYTRPAPSLHNTRGTAEHGYTLQPSKSKRMSPGRRPPRERR